jgi:predicted rRNA methylase YqxC with S4 and FtsJ domains
MSEKDRTLGIDVSKQQLDVHLQPDDRSWQVPNTDDGVRHAIQRL